MRIIPVIDILNGQVVHARKGERSVYQPLKSVLCDSTDPLDVAFAFKKLGFHELYVADLDAIIDCTSDFQVLKSIAEKTGLGLTVDAGVSDLDRARNLLCTGAQKLVVGTETLRSLNFVSEAVEAFGSNRVIISLDLKGEKVFSKQGFDGSSDPVSLLCEFQDLGVSQIIVLDLTRVGSGEGVNVDFLKAVVNRFAVEFYVGGGVRNLADLVELTGIGISGVLVATALHTGAISIQDLRQANLL